MASPSAAVGRREQVVAALAVALAVVGFLVHARTLEVQVVDDAAISVAYAQTLAEGDGPRLTPSSAPVEGFSNPLWVGLLALAVLVGFDGLASAAVLGLAFGAAALVLFALWGPAAGRRALRLEDALAPALAAPVSAWAYWAASGMETGLFALLLAAAGLLVVWRDAPAWRSPVLGGVLALLCLTRPEGPLYVLGAAGVRLVAAGRAWRREALAMAVPLALVLGIWLSVRWWAFADWLPNTFAAKQGWDFGAWPYLVGFVKAYPAPLAAGALGLVLALVLGRGRDARAWTALAFLAAGAAFAFYAKGDWMKEWRFLAPLVPVLGAGAAAGWGAVRARAPRTRWVAWAAAAGVVWFAATPSRSEALRRDGELPAAYVADWAVKYRDLLDRLGVRRPVVALPDIGGSGLVLRHAEVVDPAGLADHALARTRDAPALAADYLLHDAQPDLVDIHGPSNWLRRVPGLRRYYVPARPRLATDVPHFLLVHRALLGPGDRRCPGGRDAVLALSDHALGDRVAIGLETDPAEALSLWRCARRWRETLPSPEWQRDLSRRARRRADAWLDGCPAEVGRPSGSDGAAQDGAGPGGAAAAGAASDGAASAGAASDTCDPRRALRALSLATVLSGGDAHLRRRTEALRRRVVGGGGERGRGP